MVKALKLLLNAGLVSASGYPLYFGSFNKVGEPERIEHSTLPVEQVDTIVSEWLGACKAEAYLLIRDSTVFDSIELSKVKKLAEMSLTRGSFLTDYSLNLRDLAEDLAEHCHAKMVQVDPYNEVPLGLYVDSVPRVLYLEFDHTDTVDKDQVLDKVLKQIPSPEVTVIYTSNFQQNQPVFKNVQSDPRRLNWKGNRPSQPLKPIRPPRHPQARRKKPIPKPLASLTYDIPDQAFQSIVLASCILVVMLLLRNMFT